MRLALARLACLAFGHLWHISYVWPDDPAYRPPRVVRVAWCERCGRIVIEL